MMRSIKFDATVPFAKAMLEQFCKRVKFNRASSGSVDSVWLDNKYAVGPKAVRMLSLVRNRRTRTIVDSVGKSPVSII